ncbi:hypothetical protein BH10ACI1_BH10ACI1_15920 [soil metagenome]
MNCDLCKQHIMATTQVAWNGGNYHADCITEALAQRRAEVEKPLQVSSSEIEALENEEIFEDGQIFNDDFEDGFTDDEQYDDSDIEDIIARLDEEPEVADEILEQIPASVLGGNGGMASSEPIQMPVGSMIVAPRAIIHPPVNGGNVGTLISGMTTTLINREALRHLPVPEATDTFKPIPHFELVDNIIKSLFLRRLDVVREEYAVSFDGMKLFGLIELNVEYSGVRFAIGLRNANDKSMRVGLVAGYRVMVCENKMLTGDFQPMLAKHSKNFDLLDALSIGVDRIQRNIGTVSDEIERKKVTLLREDEARSLIYQAFLNQRFPISLLRTVHNEYFVKPSYEELAGNTLWSLENSFTSSFKKLKPVQQFEAAAKLGKFLSPHVSPF